jgi:hypothetical protein
MSDDIDKQLAKLYYTASDPAAFSSAGLLYQRARELGIGGEGLSREQVQAFLQGEQAYRLHRRGRKHFPRNHTYVARID